MSTDNGKVQIPWQLAKQIIHKEMSITTLRLFFSMLHQLDLADLDYQDASLEPPTIWASCAALRARVGPKRPNGARDLRTALRELLNIGYLEAGALLDRNTIFQWQFSSAVWAHMQNRSAELYVLIDLDELAKCQSWFTLMIYVQMRKIRGCAAPQFRVGIDPDASIAAQPKRPLAATQRVARILDVTCYVSLNYASHAPIPDYFLIRMTQDEVGLDQQAPTCGSSQQ